MPHLLFEEEGTYKAASVLTSSEHSIQIEHASGKRAKIKATQVLLRFEAPAPAALLEQAKALATEIDIDFLWQCAPQDEFSFETLARDYFGASPTAVQGAALLLRLASAPIYFQRKGRGRFRPAAPEVLQAALAAVERKRLQEERKLALCAALVRGELPTEIRQQAMTLLLAPDKNSVEFKALDAAATQRRLTPLRLLIESGAIASAYRLACGRIFFQHLPRWNPVPAACAAIAFGDAADRVAPGRRCGCVFDRRRDHDRSR